MMASFIFKAIFIWHLFWLPVSLFSIFYCQIFIVVEIISFLLLKYLTFPIIWVHKNKSCIHYNIYLTESLF